jgi:phosphocarrier protein HPr
MLRKELIVRAKDGLRGDNAELFTGTAGKFGSRIEIESRGMDKRINAKSVMGVLSLGIRDGDTIMLVASGDDEQEAVRTLADLVRNGFEY